MGIAAAIGVAAVGTVASGVINSSAASKAADTASSTAAANNALQSQIYDSNKDLLTPTITSGQNSTSTIDGLLGTGGDAAASAKAYSDWQNSTGYQQALKTGQDSVTAALGQKGLTDSGAADKALLTYGQNAANQNEQTYIGNLQGQQSAGLGAAQALTGAGQSYAGAVSANNNTASNTSANADLSSANSISSSLNNLTQIAALGTSYANGGSSIASTGRTANAALGAQQASYKYPSFA